MQGKLPQINYMYVYVYVYVYVYNLREFALHTTVILAQPRENQAPSGCRLRRSVGAWLDPDRANS